MTHRDWAKRDELFNKWERADGILLKAALRFPDDGIAIERIYQDERQAMTRLADFDRAMGLRPTAGRSQGSTRQAVA